MVCNLRDSFGKGTTPPTPFGKEIFEQWDPDLSDQGTEAMKPDQKRNDFV